MLDKIKKAITSIDEVQTIKKELLNVKKELSSSKKIFDETLKEFENALSKQNEQNSIALKEKDQSIKKIKNIAEEFEKSLNEFKIMKSNLQTKVVQEVSSDIKKELNVYVMNVKEKISQLDEAGKEILKVSENTSEMLKVFSDLRDISKKINKEDFILSKHAEELRRNDNEKLELMKKIDNLERLIAKQRKSNNKAMPKY